MPAQGTIKRGTGGSGTPTTVNNNSGIVIFGDNQSGINGGVTDVSNAGNAVIIDVAGTQAFDLNIEFDPNDDGTWYVAKQTVSSTVTVDSDTASYTQAARIAEYMGAKTRVSIYNKSGSNGTFVWCVRGFKE